ncbi:MAG: type II secretion system F family protein [Phycisphaeraceae bacterium]|nr:type II secretion system F family protein [Phycisphaeraceae bacterium]
MPTFQFQPLSSNGTASELSVIDAPDRAAAVRLLRQRGITPVRIEPVHGASARVEPAARSTEQSEPAPTAVAGTSHAFSLRGTMSRTEMASFVRELSTAVGAGLTLTQAMRTMAKQGHSSRQREMLMFLVGELEHGRSFSDAAQSWGKPFTDLTISLIRAGEASGKLPEVLEQAAALLDKDVKLRRAIIGATTYPMILGVLVVAAVVIVVTVIVPQVLAPFAGQKIVLPLPTRIVSAVAAFFGAWWWLVTMIAIAAALLWPRFYRRPANRLMVDTLLLRIPVLGRLLGDVAVARFTRTLGTLVSAGLPALTALRTTKATLGNKAMEGVIEGVCDEVAAGKTISEPLESAGMFPPLLVQIVSVGERSGRLPQLLSQAADAMESRTDASLKLFTTVLPPLLVVVLAAIVGFVVASIMLPLLQMQDYIR